MSLNELSNSVFPNTLNGLDSLNVTDITINGETLNSLFVPYTGAVSNTDLNNKSLTGVNTLSATSVTASGLVQGLNVTATGLTTTNTLKINSVPAGTVVKALAVDASGNVIEGSLIPSQINVSAITPGYASPMYFSYIITNSAGDRVLYVDTVDPITYSTNSKTLSIKNLYANTGSTWNNYGTTFSQVLQCSGFSASSTATFPQFCNFSTLPNVGVPSYFLAVDSSNQVVVSTGISAQPTITATNTNATYYLTFAPNATTTASSPLYVDGGASLTYNAFSNTLTVPIAEIPTSLTANGSFTANGSNSIAGYAPLNSPALTGIPTSTTGLAGTSSTQIATQEFVIDSLPNLTGYIQKTGTQGGINTTLQLSGTSSQFAIQSSTSSPLFSVRQSATPYVTADSLYVTNYLETGGSATIATSLEVTNAFDASSFGVIVRSSGLNLINATAPFIRISPGASAGNYIGQATSAGDFINDSVAGDFNINSLTGNVRIAGGAQSTRTNLLITNTKITANSGMNLIDPLGNPNYGQIVLCTNATTGYGLIQRHDGANFYFLVTDNNNPQGVWNGLRPFYIDMANGRLYSNNGQTFEGGTTINNGGLNYANFGGSSMNLLRGNTVFYGTVATGSNAVLQVDWASGINASVLNTATYNWQFVTGGSGSTVMNLISNSLSVKMGSMFDFSIGSAGGWTNSNSLHITTGGLGGNNAGVGIGFNTTLDSGLLCSIAPNVVWKRMTYKANDHLFTVAGNTSMVTINTVGLNISTAGYMTNAFGAANAGLSGYGAGDLIFYANGSGVMRFYNQATCKVAIGADRIYADQIQSFSGITFTMPADITFSGVPSIRTAGNGINWFMNGVQQLGYWDLGTSGNNWRMNAQNQLQIGGQGGIYCNFNTPICYQGTFFGPAFWNGGCLFTNNFSNGIYDVGVNIGWSQTAGWGHIICLQPSVQWHPFVVSCGQFSAFYFGGHAAYTTAGGWNNISDEREKEDIKPLKTNRSLERVLAAKTYTYKRKFYLNDEGKDLVPDDIKNKYLVGVMAQQIQESNPHCISTWDNDQKEERFGVCYNDYVIHLLGAVQEQQKQIDQLVKKDADKDATIQQLVAHVAKLTEVVNKLSSGAITPR